MCLGMYKIECSVMSVKYTPSSENTNASFINPIPFNIFNKLS